MSVVPKELEKAKYDVAILNCGPNEISNLNTNMDYYENINEWQNKVAKTSQKMYTLTENSLKNNPSLEKVIIVKQLPRFDNKVKADLADYANHILEQEWIKMDVTRK